MTFFPSPSCVRTKLTLEPLVCIYHPPDHHRQHGPSPHKTRPVHQRRIQITASDTWQTQNRNHEHCKARRECSDNWRVLAQMPWTSPKSVADKEGSNGNWDGESNKGGNGGNAEDCTDCDDAAKD